MLRLSPSHLSCFDYPNSRSIRQFQLYADDVNLLGGNINKTKKNTEVLIDASKEIDLAVDTEKRSMC
jgi:hypothetical protein